MKKQLLSTLLTLCMVLVLMPVTAWAADSDFVIEDGVLTKYQGSDDAVTVPDGVTSIGRLAFAGRYNLTSVTIPASVTSIGEDAFLSCIGLESVTILASIPTIGRGVFNGCESLTSVTIPASITSIEEWAFWGCNSLKDVYYGGSEGQWKQIAVGENNDPLLKANIQYNNAMPGAPTTPAGPEQPTTPSAPVTPSGISVTVDGTNVIWTDAAPFIDANSRTMVPLRAVADAMGLDVNWDGSAREAVFTNGSKTIYFPIDSNTARTSDGGAVQMDTAAVIVNERTYAPIRYLAEYFGYEVGWDAATRTVTIK